MAWIHRIVTKTRALRSAAERLSRVQDIKERLVLAAAIDREFQETWPSRDSSPVVRAVRAHAERVAPGATGGVSTPLLAVRAAVKDKRGVLVSNRRAPEVTAQLWDDLGLECDSFDVVGAPRRRANLIERIRHGSYDVVMVAQGFAGHGDTKAIKEACDASGAMNILVGKGRFGQIVESIYRCLSSAPRES
jgi:hypothetical protein